MATFTGTSGNDIFTGGSANDTAAGNGGDDNLSGAGGDDVLVGNGGADTLNGGDGNDWLYGGDQSPAYNAYTTPPTYPLLDTGTEQDTLNGGAGSDAIFAGYGDNVDGGADLDTLLISFLGAPSGITFDLHLSTQTIGGGIITGIETVNWVQGSNFGDYIDASGGSGYGEANLFGMAGDDTLIASYYTGIMDGGDGNDTVDGRNSGYLRTIYGGSGDDIVYADANTSAVAYGDDGNDTIHAGGEVHGGNGNDTILLSFSYYNRPVYGEAGDDHIEAATSGNTIFGGSGSDTINGNSNNDILGSADFVRNDYNVPVLTDDMGLEHDVLAGLGGNDILAVGYGDSADGGTGTDTLRLSLGGLTSGVDFSTAGIVSGQPFALGGGTIQNIETLEYLRGTEFDDSLTIATQATLLTVNSSAGNDSVYSQNSSVALSGGDGNDIFYTGAAGDSFDGGTGIDTIDYRFAASGVTVTLGANGTTGTGAGGDQLVNVENIGGSIYSDSLTGNELANYLQGQDGNDTLTGNGGDDTLDGGGGADIMNGGAGDDTYGVDNAADSVAEAAGAGTDSLTSWIDYQLPDNVENLWLTGLPGALAITGTGNGLDNIINGNGAANTISGLAGNDTLYGWEGDDTLNGGDGDDYLYGENVFSLGGYQFTGNDTLIGGAGNDYLFGGAGTDIMRGGSGDDEYGVHEITDVVEELAGEGEDGVWATISYALGANVENLGISGDNLIGTGNELDNYLSGMSSTADRNILYGLGGNDLLIGYGGDDTLDGGDGNDELQGRDGADTLTGGAGNDIFLGSKAWHNGDTITDFAAGDKIVITDANLAGFTFSLSGHTLTYSGGSLTLSNVPSGTLVASAGAGGEVQLTFVSNDVAAPHAGDFNGDGKADILWREDAGTITDWLGTANGGFSANWANSASRVPTDWHVAGIGDFNGDHRDDILWRNDNGLTVDWLGIANGGFIDNYANSAVSVSTDWHVAGTGDFNGDGKDDILWRNDSGLTVDWLGAASGGFTVNYGNSAVNVPTNWKIAGSGDFNGDGKDDILWRDGSTGLTVDWLGQANGGFSDNYGNSAANVPTDWHVAGTGDFNGDGHDDILWRNDSGLVTEWLGQANGGFNSNWANVAVNVPTAWKVAQIGDFNGDGKDDVLWRSDSGQTTDWLGTANGGFTDNYANAATFVPTNWHVQAEPFL